MEREGLGCGFTLLGGLQAETGQGYCGGHSCSDLGSTELPPNSELLLTTWPLLSSPAFLIPLHSLLQEHGKVSHHYTFALAVPHAWNAFPSCLAFWIP